MQMPPLRRTTVEPAPFAVEPARGLARLVRSTAEPARGTVRPVRAWATVRGGVVLAAMALSLASCSTTGGSPAGDQPPPAPAPAFSGISVASADHSVAVRELFAPDPGPDGYPAGARVPLAVEVWNNTNATVSLTGAGVTGGAPASLIDVKATASAPATSFSLPIGASAKIQLTQQSGQFLQVTCAARALTTGSAIPMTFTFSNGATIATTVPIGHLADQSPTNATPTC